LWLARLWFRQITVQLHAVVYCLVVTAFSSVNIPKVWLCYKTLSYLGAEMCQCRCIQGIIWVACWSTVILCECQPLLEAWRQSFLDLTHIKTTKSQKP
jgi:hypothetical protein